MTLVKLAAAMLGGLSASLVAAQSLSGDPGRGRDLAREVCVACHAVESADYASTNISSPSFQELADNPEINAINLRVLLQSPHREMPDLILDAHETDDVIAYILSLR